MGCLHSKIYISNSYLFARFTCSMLLKKKYPGGTQWCIIWMVKRRVKESLHFWSFWWQSFPTSTLVVHFVSLALYAIWQKNLSFVLAVKSVWGIRLIVLWLPCRRYCTSFRDKEKRLWYTGMIANQRKVCVAPVLCCLNIGINNRQTKCPWKQLIVFSKGVAKQIFWSFSLFFYSTSNTAITLNGGHFGPIILSDCMTNWTCIITQKFPLKNKSMRCHTIVWPFHWRIILLRLNKDSQPNEYPAVFIFKFLHWNIIRVW